MLQWLQGTEGRKLLIGGGILLLALTHWIWPLPDKNVHNLLYHLDFIPILIAGMLFGWRSSLVASAAIVVAELPMALLLWSHDIVYLMDQAGETFVFAVAGVVVGFMAERERHQKAVLEGTTQELEKVNLELQQNLERLKRAERMYAVAQLSASLAHEIRNPLAGISGAAGILKRGQATAENFQECLGIIDKESQRLNKLLTNFLDFARPRAPRFQSTELTAVIDSVIALATRSPEAGSIRFVRDIDGILPEVQCDSEQLKQVLLNLVKNAVQATRDGAVRLHAYCRAGNAFITVSDNGGGVPAEQEHRIFDPFFTTKENGTGLGLAIASKIVEQHGGVLSAENHPGRGLTMLVQLPLEREVPA
ncbi:MAG: ATP-binding protein [Bryobacteraceae bacterium]